MRSYYETTLCRYQPKLIYNFAMQIIYYKPNINFSLDLSAFGGCVYMVDEKLILYNDLWVDIPMC